MSYMFSFKRAVQFATVANDGNHNSSRVPQNESGRQWAKEEEQEEEEEKEEKEVDAHGVKKERRSSSCDTNGTSKLQPYENLMNGKTIPGCYSDHTNNSINLKFVSAWQKAKLTEKEEKQVESREKRVPKMAKVVGTAKTVNKASKSLLSLSVRDRVKKRMQKIAEERLTVKQIFTKYVEYSTLHGFRYTCTDTYLIRRIIWAILMILGAVYFIVKLKEGIIEYISYPFSTLSTLEYINELPMPAISFCTINQFDYSKLQTSPLLQLYKNNRLPFHRNWSDPGFDIPGDELIEEIKKTSFHIEDIFMECDFVRQDTDNPNRPPRICGTKNFTRYFSDSGQLCYTLNSGNTELLKVEHAGLKQGYEILFDLRIDEVARLYEYAGLQVIVHDQGEPPSSDVGFVLTPGFHTYVSLQRTETKNLPPPYATKCGVKKLKYFDTYSQKACLLEKLTDYTAEKCHCREPFMPGDNLKYCSLQEKILCAFSAKETFNEHEMRHHCPIDCEITSYTTRISDSRFLHSPPKGVDKEYLESLKIKNITTYIEKLSKRHPEPKELRRYVAESIIQVIFFFGEMSKVVNEQEATFDFYQFLGDMGGEIGLMLGASLLTFFEFLDLIAFLAYHQLLRLHKQKKELSESRKISVVADSKRQSIANERQKQSIINNIDRQSIFNELKTKNNELHASETSLVIPNNETNTL